MKRRSLFKQAAWLATGSLISGKATAATVPGANKNKPVLTIAHITDVHIRPEENIPQRFKKCLDDVKKHRVDFILNGGDSIHAADYDDIKRERVTEQWAAWDDCMQQLQSYDIFSCIGNHDSWWAAPSKEDGMYGKDYVVKRLKIPNRYYSFTRKGWHFIVLDGNNKNISLDEEQYNWLVNDLEKLPAKYTCFADVAFSGFWGYADIGKRQSFR